MTEPMLALRGLRKAYGAKPALRGLDLDVPDNQIVALLGPTGAGKSSTLLASAGLITLDAGQVSLAGVDVTDADPSARDVSIVFEGYNLLPVLDVKDNIAFALRSPGYREPEAEIRERVGRTAELLRIAHLLDRNVTTLSGGESQRVAIARALVRRPKLFLLDEPLSALDLKLREGLRAELRAIHRRYRSTMLYATHDYHGAIAIADQIAIIEGGRIQQFGAIETIFMRPANMRVGQLIGSPSMAFFDAVVAEGAIAVAGGGQRMALADFGASRLSRDGRFKLGAWPEDIEIRAPGASDGNSGAVYAVDNRGYEQAVQVNADAGAFRKVLPTGVDLRQGDACSFHIRSGFLFDAESGERLSQTGDA